MAVGQTRQRGPLVAGVVVDVQARVVATPFGQVVHELLEGLPLGRPVGREAVVERPRDVDPPEEVLQTAVLGVREALHVEEDVAVVRRGQEVETVTWHRRQPRVRHPPLFPAVDLLPGLPLEPIEHAAADRHGGGRRLGRQRRQPRHRRHPGRLEPLDLLTADAGHEGEVVVPSTAVVAVPLPRAEGAVLDRVRVRRRGGQRAGETRLDGPQVRRDRGVCEPLLRSVAEGQDQPTRLDALERREQLRVERHLDEGGRLRPPGQLRVDHVVGVRPRAAGRPAADQEVRMAQPRAVEKGPLVDDVVTVGQGGHRRPLRLFERRSAQ